MDDTSGDTTDAKLVYFFEEITLYKKQNPVLTRLKGISSTNCYNKMSIKANKITILGKDNVNIW